EVSTTSCEPRNQLPSSTLPDTVEWPLTAPQLGVWLDEQRTADAARYTVGDYWRIHGDLHLPRLPEGVQFVVDTTEALRLQIQLRGGIPVQQLGPHVPVELQHVDFRGSVNGEEEAQRWMDRDMAQPFTPASYPFFSYAALRVTDDCWFFQYKYHHL